MAGHLYIERVVQSAPPLTSDQRDQLGLLLRRTRLIALRRAG